MSNYKILNEKLIYNSEKFRFIKAKIQLPNGNIDNWDVIDHPNFVSAIPIIDNHVIMTKEWRPGPQKVIYQLTGASTNGKNLNNLKKELKEELGLEGGNFSKLISFYNGAHYRGTTTYYTVRNFEIIENDPDENEILRIVKLPIKGLYNFFLDSNATTGPVLFIAKLIEEKCSSS
jgi:8-oxo-dGTP pyrophosphatase MutT (NUDIX family)